MKDYRFHCKDCDSFNQCQYYHNRKGTSFICKEFQYGVIEQIRAEIEEAIKVDPYRLYAAIEIIDKYRESEDKE